LRRNLRRRKRQARAREADARGATAIYTIGHSNHSAEAFLSLLERHRIEAVADVRSFASSRRHPQFNGEALARALAGRGIRYVFLGKELGAKHRDASCRRDGRVDYDLVAETPEFRQGLERVREGARRMRVALMCAEKEPLDCHRTLLVARHLRDLRIRHILADGSIEEHAETEGRLLALAGGREAPLLAPLEDATAVLDRAYRARSRAIAPPAPDD
jgi:uncharacterized protein (DUF488 family)